MDFFQNIDVTRHGVPSCYALLQSYCHYFKHLTQLNQSSLTVASKCTLLQVTMERIMCLLVCDNYLLYQLKSSQLTPSSWYSLSVFPFVYSLDSSNFFHELAGGRGWGERGKNGWKKIRGAMMTQETWCFCFCWTVYKNNDGTRCDRRELNGGLCAYMACVHDLNPLLFGLGNQYPGFSRNTSRYCNIFVLF